MLAHLVVASVFKTVGSYVNRAIGGFDSHALPPFFLASCRARSHRFADLRKRQWVAAWRHPSVASPCDLGRVCAAPDFAPHVRRFLRRLQGHAQNAHSSSEDSAAPPLVFEEIHDSRSRAAYRTQRPILTCVISPLAVSPQRLRVLMDSAVAASLGVSSSRPAFVPIWSRPTHGNATARLGKVWETVGRCGTPTVPTGHLGAREGIPNKSLAGGRPIFRRASNTACGSWSRDKTIDCWSLCNQLSA